MTINFDSRITRWGAAGLLWISMALGLRADDRLRIMDPQSVSAGASGWAVADATGALSMSLPVATVPGEIPIPVVFRYSGSAATWTESRLFVGSVTRSRGIYGDIHFGYITPPKTGVDPMAGYGAYVLEDGRTLMEADWLAGTSLPGGTFNLAQAFGFPTRTAAQVKVDAQGTLALFDATTTDLGNWASWLLLPKGYGVAPTAFKVIMDKDRARVYAYLGEFGAWAPLIWVDRFGHSVTFQWQKNTSGLPTGVSAVHVLTVLNQRSKGVQLQWAIPSDASTPTYTLRADMVGIPAPSIAVTGYYGPVGVPGDYTSGGSGGGLGVFLPGPVCRPTKIQVGSASELGQSAWQSAGKSLPLASSPSEGNAPVLTWTFSYDGEGKTLVGISDPTGVQTTFTYGTATFYSASSARHKTISAVTRTESLDGGTEQKLTRTWDRTLPVFNLLSRTWTQPKWIVNAQSSFSGPGVDAGANPRVTQLVFSPATETRDYGNASLVSSATYPASAVTSGVTADIQSALSATTYRFIAYGLDKTWSRIESQTSTLQGEPSRTVGNIFDLDGTMPKSQSLRDEYGRGQTTYYDYEAHWDLLEGNRPVGTRFSTAQYNEGWDNRLVTEYNSQGLPSRTYRPSSLGQVGQVMTYDGEGRLATIGNFASFTQAGRSQKTLSYDSNGLVQNTATQITSDLSGDPNALTPATQESWAYDAAGRPLTSLDERGVQATYTWDLRGRLVSKSLDGEGAITYAYPTELTTQITQNGLTSTEVVDGFGRLIQRTDPDGGTEYLVYDALGRMVASREVNPAGTSRSTTTTYDDMDRVVSVASPGGIVGYTYGGNTRTKTFQGTNATIYEIYDVLGRLISTVNPDGSVVTATYDDAGRATLVKVQERQFGEPQVRTRTYDALGRLTSKTDPETGTQTFAGFDAMGLPHTITEAAGTPDARTRRLSYDGFGRLLRVLGANGENLTRTYSGAFLTSVSSAIGSDLVTQSFAYRGPGKQLSQETTSQTGFSSTISYGFDGQGRMNSLTYPSGRVVGYEFDGLSRISRITHNGVKLADQVFDDWGNRKRLAFASGALSEWISEMDGAHLKKWSFGYVGGTPEVRKFQYDAAENLLQAGEWSLQHDAAGRMTQATGMGISTLHGYDGFGNNTSHLATPDSAMVPNTMNNFSLGALPTNRMPALTTNGASTGWMTNARGEATSIGTGTATNMGLGLGWDGLGRLASVAYPGGIQSYRYSPTGMRLQVLDSANPSNNRRFTYTTGGLLLGEYGGADSGVHGGQKAARIWHRSPNSSLSRFLGHFNAGDTLSVTVWFKAPKGTSGAIFLGDNGTLSLGDNKEFLAVEGNGSWQSLVMNHRVTRADDMWIHLIGDNWTSTSGAASTLASVVYDDIKVSSALRGPILDEGFESGLNLSQDPRSATGWYSCGQPNDLVTATVNGEAWKRDVIYLGSEAIAEVDANGIHELHRDHLGTPRLITAGSGAAIGTIEGRQAYGPYGEMIQSQGYVPLTGYTGHLQTDATGLIYMRARYYSPAWHRFLNSNDGVDPNFPNQFAYGGSDPFSITDPTGLDGEATVEVWGDYVPIPTIPIDYYALYGYMAPILPFSSTNPYGYQPSSPGNQPYRLPSIGAPAPKPKTIELKPKTQTSSKDPNCVNGWKEISAGDGQRVASGMADFAGTPYAKSGGTLAGYRGASYVNKVGSDCGGSVCWGFENAGYGKHYVNSSGITSSPYYTAVASGQQRAGDVIRWGGHVATYDPNAGGGKNMWTTFLSGHNGKFAAGKISTYGLGTPLGYYRRRVPCK